MICVKEITKEKILNKRKKKKESETRPLVLVCGCHASRLIDRGPVSDRGQANSFYSATIYIGRTPLINKW